MEAVVGVCAHCRRPNDEVEIEQALAQERDKELEAKRRPKKQAAAVGAAALLVLLYVERDIPARMINGWRSEFSTRMEKAAGPGVAATPETASQAPNVEALGRSAPGTPPPPLLNVRAAPPEPKQEPKIVPLPPLHAAPEPVPELVLGANDWGLSGRAYDLKTLAPLTAAKIVFTSPEHGQTLFALTREDGSYQVALPKDIAEGFAVRIEAAGYVPWALAEPDIPYATLSSEDRKQLITVAADGDAPPSRVNEPAVGSKGKRDIFAAPR